MSPNKPLEIPPTIARAFAKAVEDYFSESNHTKQDAIAAHTLKLLKDYDSKLRLSDVKAMFREMRGKV